MSDKIQVQIQILPWFSEILVPGQRSSLLIEEDVQAGTTLRMVFRLLADRYPRFEETIYGVYDDAPRATVMITYNGRLISPGTDLDQVLQHGDQIALIPAYSGG